ncbi:MAG TPA: peroxidase [Thermoanaerobaculia bacterium]|nr:peroxidase [Thermoanaerobaculia bacterium]
MTDLRASDEIQGNVLTPFPDGEQAFLLLHFADAEGARALLAEILPGLTTTASLLSSPPRVCRGVGFTASGLRKLAPLWAAGLEPFLAFREGPAVRAPRLRDHGPSAPERWVFGTLDPGVDAVLTLASAEPAAAGEEAAHWQERSRALGVHCLFDQRGARLPGIMAGCEHFGFKDGISQPAVRGFDRAPAGLLPAGEFILGRPRLAAGGGEAEPLPCPDWMCDGSFQVLRRLSQDVAGWRAQLARLAASLSPERPMCPHQLAAKLMGRWQSGTPLALSPDRDDHSPPEAEYDYNDDPFGYKTPRFAHARKMYPRDDAFFEKDWHRIIRRGIPFGPIYEPGSETAGAERGLLLNAFMASLENQFEFLMRGWANDPDFIEAGDGPDPLIGESGEPATLRHPEGCPTALRFERFVHTTGAVYAFVPARSVVARLAAGEGT